MLLIPTLEEIYSYAGVNDITHADLDAFFEYYDRNGWRTANGETINDWRPLLQRWEQTAIKNRTTPQPKRKTTEPQRGAEYWTAGELDIEVIRRQKERYKRFLERYNDPENHEPSIEYVRQKDREAAEADARKN